MTAKDSQFFLGKRASYQTINGLRVDVVIEDVKISWGATRFQITPVSGSGSVWVDSGSVVIHEQKPLDNANVGLTVR